MNERVIPASWSEEYQDKLYKALRDVHREKLKSQLNPEEEMNTAFHISEIEAEPELENGTFRGLATGYEKLDQLVFGIEKGDLIVIAGRGGTGKTMFSISLMLKAMQALPEPNLKTLIFSLEMSNRRLKNRIKGMASRTSLRDYLDSLPIYLYNNVGHVTLKKLRKSIQDRIKDEGLDLVIIDHLHYFAYDTVNQTNEVGKIVREIKRMAVEFDIPILLLSQVRKGVAGGGKETNSDDIRDSGMVQADADTVIILNRDYMNDQEKHKLKVAVEKNRNKGQTGWLMMYIDKNYMLTETIPGFTTGR